VVLAAGESKRMNFPKMLLLLNGRTMIETVIEKISESQVDKIMVVTGAYRDEIEEAAGNFQIQLCHNEKYKDGMLSSVKCAFRSIPAEARQVLVFPGDKPLITPEVINLLIDACKREKKGIIIPVYQGKRGHPILIDMKYRDEITRLAPEEGLRSLARHFQDDVLEVETGDPGVINDIDTYDDYVRLVNQT